ncbi:hypothetical protein QAD02_004461 [Eretmocerus hayati]|uniref:Uncharacterized protein n=1 Tax=Eretmocerus hayati TaxID=131215 RepID=A0ACC2NQ36_9HYME|nr:hypothetical protein QAD02_004461 [Eretmocerus hayati]
MAHLGNYSLNILSCLLVIVSCYDFTPPYQNRPKVARYRSVQDCMAAHLREHSRRSINLNSFVTTPQIINRVGYPSEQHIVSTEDGYYLTVHRIPGKPGSMPVFLQHGMFSSSFDWVVAGRDRGLAFILADQGYDVWLGNTRGNLYSSCHTHYTPDDQEFWNFSWHEMGVYDTTAVVEYITKATNQNLIYIGHSMGTTMSYVMAIERPDVASKVKAIFSLSPVVYVSNAKSFLFSSAKAFKLEKLRRILPLDYLFSHLPEQKSLIESFCNPNLHLRMICLSAVSGLFGHNLNGFDFSLLPRILSHDPAGVSLKTIIHFHQLVHSNRFAHFDYGPKVNLDIYGSAIPPDYDISKIQVPVGIFWAENDPVADPRDIQRFYSQLPKPIFNLKVDHNKFNHLDFLWANDAGDYVYSKLISAMKEYQ